jgi:hypothetical protein
MICKRLDVSPPKRYQLTTLRGFTLSDNDSLASYGLGSLLPNWQLKLERKKQAGTARGLARVTTLARFDLKHALLHRKDDDDSTSGDESSPRLSSQSMFLQSTPLVNAPTDA